MGDRPSRRTARRVRRLESTHSRGVTTALRYALLLAIVAILVSGLYVGVSDLVETQQERAIGSQLETVGNRLAADLGTASRLVETGETSTTVELQTRLPDAVGGSEYVVDIDQLEDGPRYEYALTLRSVEPAVEASVVVRTTVPVREGTVPGGRLTVEYDGSDPVVVRRA